MSVLNAMHNRSSSDWASARLTVIADVRWQYADSRTRLQHGKMLNKVLVHDVSCRWTRLDPSTNCRLLPSGRIARWHIRMYQRTCSFGDGDALSGRSRDEHVAIHDTIPVPWLRRVWSSPGAREGTEADGCGRGRAHFDL